VKGKFFVEAGFGHGRCIFNTTHITNATVVSETLLYCSTPKLNDFEASLPYGDMKYIVQVSMNGKELTDGKGQFDYYHEIELSDTRDSNIGPVTGSTLSQIEGRGFTHPNICNLKMRYGALEVTPTQVFNNTLISALSPVVAVTGAVELAASGNGQQYGRDWVYHHRDLENTFTYYQDILVHTLRPQSGPTTGRTRVAIAGIGFEQIRSESGPMRTDIPLWIKFTDLETGADIGNATKISNMDDDTIWWHTPNATEGTKAILNLSFNKQNWQQVIPTEKTFSYLYYNAPVVTSLDPRIGPVKNPDNLKTIVNGKNFICPNGDCKNVKVRFGDPEFGTIVPGTVLSPEKIECVVPHYPKPDIMYVDVSMNGDDYTNDHVNYGFYDAYVIDVNPKLIPAKGGTKLTVKGFGFVDTEHGVKSKFGSKDKGEFGCSSGSPCIAPATFVDGNNIITYSEPQDVMNYQGSHGNIGSDGFTVDVSVYGNQFTENGIQVFYIFDPDFISINRNSVPRNLQVPIIIKTDFHWDRNKYEMFAKYGNFTCKYVIGETEPEIIVTQGRMETMPLGSMYLEGDAPRPTHIICPSPKWIKEGKGVLEISVNGVDYLGTYFPFESTPVSEIFRVLPLSGPKHVEHSTKVIGSGFKASSDPLSIRTGNFGLEPIRKDQVIEYAWNSEEYQREMYLTSADFRSYQYVQHELKEGEKVDSIW